MSRLCVFMKTASPPQHLLILLGAKDVPKADELLLVPGNPASGSRLSTIAELEFYRDWQHPTRQLIRSELRGRLYAYSALSEENHRQAAETLYGVENNYKSTQGQWLALLDPIFMAEKRKEESELRAAIANNAALAKEIGDPWADAMKAVLAYEGIYYRYDMLESRAGSISELFAYARTIVRGAEESTKPNGDRLPEFTESALPLTEKALLEPKPIYPGLERIGLELWLSKTRELLAVDDPSVKTLAARALH